MEEPYKIFALKVLQVMPGDALEIWVAFWAFKPTSAEKLVTTSRRENVLEVELSCANLSNEFRVEFSWRACDYKQKEKHAKSWVDAEPTSSTNAELSCANLSDKRESATIHYSRMSQRIDGYHCMPSKIYMLMPSFKLNFVFPVNIFASGLRAGSGRSPAPLLPFFQIVVRSPSSVGLRSWHSSKPGSARRLCSCPLPQGSAKRRCRRPLPPSFVKQPCSFARRRCGCPLPPSSTRRRCSRPVLLSSAKPPCTSARRPCGCPLSHRSSRRSRSFARRYYWRPLPPSSTRRPCTWGPAILPLAPLFHPSSVLSS